MFGNWLYFPVGVLLVENSEGSSISFTNINQLQDKFSGLQLLAGCFVVGRRNI